mmetsp:Transcript_49869/g.156074  ORF Transcript_49869/g.156074 Transcript_49869/m.156074 type:complete len:89 (-) Transcript_49869:744-1010(-)
MIPSTPRNHDIDLTVHESAEVPKLSPPIREAARCSRPRAGRSVDGIMMGQQEEQEPSRMIRRSLVLELPGYDRIHGTTTGRDEMKTFD